MTYKPRKAKRGFIEGREMFFCAVHRIAFNSFCVGCKRDNIEKENAMTPDKPDAFDDRVTVFDNEIEDTEAMKMIAKKLIKAIENDHEGKTFSFDYHGSRIMVTPNAKWMLETILRGLESLSSRGFRYDVRKKEGA